MSRFDLDVIQSQLRTAIQNHQMLVSRLQLQPQDLALKTQLHNIQKEIMLMSQKQKHVVEKLRKDLIERQPSSKYDKEFNTHKPVSNTKSLNQTELTQLPYGDPNIPSSQNHQPEKPPALQNRANTISPQLQNSIPEKLPPQKSAISPLRVPHFLPNASRPSVPQNISLVENKSVTSPLTECSPTPPQPRKSNIAKHIKEKQLLNNNPPENPELKKKLEFMAGIKLYPPDSLKEMQCKRSERKRRSTNNPNFAYGFELERRPRLSNYLGTDYFGAKKPRGQSAQKTSNSSPKVSRPNTPDTTEVNTTPVAQPKENGHDDRCGVCGMSGQLLLCSTCTSVFHLRCLSPPLETIPEETWSCKKCQEAHHRSAISLAAVTTYIATKTGKEEEKRKLLKRSTELLQEKTNLENRTKELNEILARQGIEKKELIDLNRKAQKSVESLKNFVKLVQST